MNNVNLSPIYYHYVSSVIVGVWQTEEEALEAAASAELGCPHPDLFWTVGCFNVGSVELDSTSDIFGVALDGYWEGIGYTQDVPWVKWGNLATQRP